MEYLSIIQSILASLAIIIGGFWGYFKFIKGRLFKPRLELSIQSELINNRNRLHLMLDYEVKNVGLSKVDLKSEASGIRVMKLILVEDPLEIESSQWKQIGTFPVFEKHVWIESGETIKETNLLVLEDNETPFYKSVFRIAGEGKSWEVINITSQKTKKSEEGNGNK